MSVGLRVVRGRDWNLGNQDGGEGHVGTVVHDNNDNTWVVVWDMGNSTQCRAGKDGKYDLKILDNAPVGVRHNNVTCDICKKNGIMGIRWKCSVCYDFDLCAPCYSMDKHDSHHPFKRFDNSSSSGVDVPKRAASQKIKIQGTFPGAEVVRGPDWEYGTQDGGSGSKGLILDVRGFGSDVGGRNAVKVRWTNDEANVYRLGCKGKVDVKCVVAATGGNYYKDHLPMAGAKESAAKANPEMNQSILKVGDKVCVDISANALKEVQRGHGGWSLRMSECVGNTGIIKDFHGDDTVEVEYDNKDTWQFYVGAVRKVHNIKNGDTVKILDSEEKVKLLQKEHGGWEDDMRQSLGKVGKVVKMDSDGDVVVAFGQQAWVFNPACLIPVQGVKTDQIQEKLNPTQSTGGDSDGDDDTDSNFARLFAHLMLLDALGRRQVGAEQIVAAAAKGSLGTVQSLLNQNKRLLNAKYKGLTPLIIASHQGHLEIVKYLVDSGADMEEVEDKGNTALLAALAGKEEEVAVFLVEKGANVNIVSRTGRTSAHCAAFEGLCTALKQVLQKGCDPNRKDADGDTPLHDAIAKKCDRAVALLLNHPKIDLKCANRKGFNLLHWSAFKGHEFAVERILAKLPGIVDDRKSDGNTALHIAAVNDHKEIASMLILKGKANVNCKTSQGLTPLHFASHEGYFEMVKVLMQNDADLSLKDTDGNTPLHLALGGRRSGDGDLFLQLLGMSATNQTNDRFKIACHMIQNGADEGARNNRGATPLNVCQNERLRNAVKEFISKVKPKQAGGARAGITLADLFSSLPTPCMLCMEQMSDARLLPCTHKVVCKSCSFKVRRCPMCEQFVAERTDLRGNKLIQVDPCRVQ